MRKKYFEEELADIQQCIHIVGLDKNQQQKLDSLPIQKKTKTPCAVYKLRNKANWLIGEKLYWYRSFSF